MNLSLPLPAYLIFTTSFQTYIVLHNHCPDGLHHFFFISGMLWVLFSSRHLEHDAHFRCDVMIVFIWIRYCFIPHPPSLSWPIFLKLWSSLKDACICFPHLICIQEVSLNVRVTGGEREERGGGAIFWNFISEVCTTITLLNINFRFVSFCIRLIKTMISITTSVIANFYISPVIFMYMVNNYNVK